MGSCPHCECFLRKGPTCLKAKCIEAEKEELRGKERRLEFENRKHDIMIKMLEKQNEAKRVAVAELTVVVRDLEEGLDGGGVEDEREEEEEVEEVSVVEVKEEVVELEEAEEMREDEVVELEEDGSIYCLCQQVSSGKMVACENQDCPLAWFHFGCVGLQSKPRGKWYCPRCKHLLGLQSWAADI